MLYEFLGRRREGLKVQILRVLNVKTRPQQTPKKVRVTEFLPLIFSDTKAKDDGYLYQAKERGTTRA